MVVFIAILEVSMRNFRKEFVIFGLVIFVVIVFFVVSSIFGRDSYRDYNVTHGLPEPDASRSVPDVSTPAGSTFVEPSSSSSVETQDPGDTYEPVTSDDPSSSEVVEPGGELGGEVTDPNAGGDAPVDGTEDDPLDVTGDVDIAAPPTPDVYESIVRYFVCGLEDESFDLWLTDELRAEFKQHEAEEPYKSLAGNITFSDVEYTDSTVKFKAKDGVAYTFSYTLVDGKLASITFEQ